MRIKITKRHIAIAIMLGLILLCYGWFGKLHGGSMRAAIEDNDLIAVKVLFTLRSGAKEKSNRFALLDAARCGRNNILSYLISRGVDINATGQATTPLHEAASTLYVYPPYVEYMQVVDYQHISSVENYYDIVKLLLSRGANANIKDIYGNTPLHYAHSSRIVELLLSHGALVEARNTSGVTPLFMKTGVRDLEIARLLISKGADVNACDKFGDTPMHTAAAQGNSKLMKLLISKGAKIDPKNDNGDTPLRLIAGADKDGSLEIVKLLVSKGADVNAKNKEGYGPLQAAHVDSDVREYLLAHGAKPIILSD